MTTEKYVVVGVSCMIIDALGGIRFAIGVERPQTAYERKIEGDERQYLVVESRGRICPMVKNQTGTFIRLEDMEKLTIDSTKKEIETLIDKVLEK